MRITDTLMIDERELSETFIRATGPGGQNVNKVSSAVQLRFNVVSSPSLPEAVRQRLIALTGSRLTNDGVLIILAQRFRTQEKNRQDARERLIALIFKATIPLKKRIQTKPSHRSKEKRLESKSKRAETKKARSKFDIEHSLSFSPML